MSLITSIFIGISALMLLLSIGVVVTKNMVHSVFLLAASLICTAALFVALDAAFIAGVQLLLYTGGVITLMLFGVMLSRHDVGTSVPNESSNQGRGLVISLVLLIPLLTAIWTTPELANRVPIETAGAEEIGAVLMTTQLLAFEMLSVLLLGAMIGAIILASKRTTRNGGTP
jgi:NADH-quinone oxidoreductase subunit J